MQNGNYPERDFETQETELLSEQAPSAGAPRDGVTNAPVQGGQPQFVPPQPVAPQPAQPQYGQPQYAQPQYGQPQYAQPQYAQPQYAQPQYGQPQYGQPQYGSPQYGQPQYGQPQYGQPQYVIPQYGQPQYGSPQYGQPQYAQPRYAQPVYTPVRSKPVPASFKGIPTATKVLVLIAVFFELFSLPFNGWLLKGGFGISMTLLLGIPAAVFLIIGSFMKNKPVFFGLGLVLNPFYFEAARTVGSWIYYTILSGVAFILIFIAGFHYYLKGRGINRTAKTVLSAIAAGLYFLGELIQVIIYDYYFDFYTFVWMLWMLAPVLVAVAAAIYSVRKKDPGSDA